MTAAVTAAPRQLNDSALLTHRAVKARSKSLFLMASSPSARAVMTPARRRIC